MHHNSKPVLYPQAQFPQVPAYQNHLYPVNNFSGRNLPSSANKARNLSPLQATKPQLHSPYLRGHHLATEGACPVNQVSPLGPSTRFPQQQMNVPPPAFGNGRKTFMDGPMNPDNMNKSPLRYDVGSNVITIRPPNATSSAPVPHPHTQQHHPPSQATKPPAPKQNLAAKQPHFVATEGCLDRGKPMINLEPSNMNITYSPHDQQLTPIRSQNREIDQFGKIEPKSPLTKLRDKRSSSLLRVGTTKVVRAATEEDSNPSVPRQNNPDNQHHQHRVQHHQQHQLHNQQHIERPTVTNEKRGREINLQIKTGGDCGGNLSDVINGPRGEKENRRTAREDENLYSKPSDHQLVIIKSPKGLNLLHFLQSKDINAELVPSSTLRLLNDNQSNTTHDQYDEEYDYVKVTLDRDQKEQVQHFMSESGSKRSSDRESSTAKQINSEFAGYFDVFTLCIYQIFVSYPRVSCHQKL